MRSIGTLVLCHLLALPTNGYISIHPSSLAPPRSAFVGLARSRQTSSISRPIIRAQRHVLFSSTTNPLYNVTDSLVSSPTKNAPSSSPKALGTSGDWSAYLDESKGLIYYFNPQTSESKWEPPEDTDFSGIQIQIGAAKKVEMRARLNDYLEKRLNYSAEELLNYSAEEFIGTMQQEREEVERKREEARNNLKMKKTKLELAKKDSLKETSSKDIVSEWGAWQARIDRKRGQIYYFNKKTRESSWDKPNGFPSFKLSASKRIALEERSKRYQEWQKDAAKVNVLGRGTVVISDSNFEGGTKATNTNEPSEPVGDPSEPVGDVNEGDIRADEKFDANQPPTLPIVQQGDWSAYFDMKTGVVFYFNEETRETSWDPPNPNFPRIVMENTIPTVLDPGSGNISMERALGYIGVDEMAEALAWEEAKKNERARKAAKRAKQAEDKEETTASTNSETEVVEIYEAAKNAELERIDQERQSKLLAEEQNIMAEAAATLVVEQEKEISEQKRIAAEEAAVTEREAAAKLAVQENLEQERLEKERLEKNRIAAEEIAATTTKLAAEEKLKQERLEKERLEVERLEAEKLRQIVSEVKQPMRPKEDPTFTAKSIETMMAPLKTNSLYDILQCSTTASRQELKRSYLSLAKETHPDALLQNGMVNDAKTERRFGEISQAWKILGDPTSRRRYDRELQAKGISSKAGNMFENWVMGAAKAMDEALAKAEDDR